MRRDLLVLLILSLSVRLVVAAFIFRPGYMDAAYYAAGAINLAQGGGLDEPFIWNYLDDPAGVPHPGFLYWMLLPSFLAAPFAAAFPGSFFALQIPFIVLSALLPLLGYTVAWQATQVRRRARVAGLLTLFSGFFFPYWTLPETFAPFALAGGVALWLAASEWRAGWLVSLLVGLLVGLAHLTRADGILFLPVVALASVFLPRSCVTHHGSRITDHASRITHRVLRFVISHLTFIILGYLLAMAPWFARNLSTVGVPLSPGGTKTLWLRVYDDLFCYGCELSPRSYLAWGWGSILRSKLWALGQNAQRFLAEDCLVFMLPFVLIGLYRLRRSLSFTLSIIYLLLVYFAHSLAFTFPGPRGGFFHATAPVLPFLFAAGAEGLDATVAWVARKRRWNQAQALTVFAAAAVIAAVILSAYVALDKLPGWRTIDRAYVEAGAWLDAHSVPADAVVMVNNPPGFWYHTRRSAVVVPAPVGDIEVLLKVVDRYEVAYAMLAGMASHPRLEPVATWDEAVLYRVAR
jgi:hypothetical protein